MAEQADVSLTEVGGGAGSVQQPCCLVLYLGYEELVLFSHKSPGLPDLSLWGSMLGAGLSTVKKVLGRRTLYWVLVAVGRVGKDLDGLTCLILRSVSFSSSGVFTFGVWLAGYLWCKNVLPQRLVPESRQAAKGGRGVRLSPQLQEVPWG